MSEIVKAIEFMRKAHAGQFRKDGITPYEVHPIRVTATAMLHNICSDVTLCAILLHDTIEDCGVTYEQLVFLFGSEVANLVLELSNPSKGRKDLTREQRKALDREHLSTVSHEAKVVKLLDRLDNISDVGSCSPEFIRLYCKETELLLEKIQDADLDIAAIIRDVIAEHTFTLNLTQITAPL